MSQIVIEIPDSALANPRVAQAVANLTLALGGHPSQEENSYDLASQAANDDQVVAGRTRREAFFTWLGERTRALQWEKLFAFLKNGGPEGVVFEEVMVACFPHLQESSEPYRATGGLIGAMSRWCKQQLGHDLPLRHEGDRLYLDESVFTASGTLVEASQANAA